MTAHRSSAHANQASRDAAPRPLKQPFDVVQALDLIREAVKPYPKAALFALAAEGFDSTFQQLVACLISIRTRDETTLPVARALFQRAATPREIAALDVAELDRLIQPSTFHQAKAGQIHAIAQRVEEEFAGDLPCDEPTLLSFRGVGPKCAALVRGVACGEASIGVDIHVHRVVNRWGYVEAKTPEKTMAALQAVLPRDYWIEINALLVPFGKHVCMLVPKCSTCPVLTMCRQVGVTKHK